MPWILFLGDRSQEQGDEVEGVRFRIWAREFSLKANCSLRHQRQRGEKLRADMKSCVVVAGQQEK